MCQELYRITHSTFTTALSQRHYHFSDEEIAHSPIENSRTWVKSKLPRLQKLDSQPSYQPTSNLAVFWIFFTSKVHVSISHNNFLQSLVDWYPIGLWFPVSKICKEKEVFSKLDECVPFLRDVQECIYKERELYRKRTLNYANSPRESPYTQKEAYERTSAHLERHFLRWF